MSVSSRRRSCIRLVVREGTNAGTAEPAEGDVHGNPYVRGSSVGLRPVLHPQSSRRDRGKVGGTRVFESFRPLQDGTRRDLQAFELGKAVKVRP